jgi:hypothetical protein
MGAKKEIDLLFFICLTTNEYALNACFLSELQKFYIRAPIWRL